jgi:hypothetical protein
MTLLNNAALSVHLVNYSEETQAVINQMITEDKDLEGILDGVNGTLNPENNNEDYLLAYFQTVANLSSVSA